MNIYKDGWHYLKQVFEDVWFYVEGGKLKKGIIGSNGDYITAYPFIYDYMTHSLIEIEEDELKVASYNLLEIVTWDVVLGRSVKEEKPQV